MMIGTSGRAAFAFGRSSRPLISGMLMSDRIRISGTVARIADALKCHGAGLSKLHRIATFAEVAPKLLAEQNLHVGLIVNHENEHVHARSPDFAIGRGPARQNDPKFSELTGLGIYLIDLRCCLTMMS